MFSVMFSVTFLVTFDIFLFLFIWLCLGCLKYGCFCFVSICKDNKNGKWWWGEIKEFFLSVLYLVFEK